MQSSKNGINNLWRELTKEYVGTQAKVMDMKIALALEECEGISKKNVAEP